jgi:hypothetical protein
MLEVINAGTDALVTKFMDPNFVDHTYNVLHRAVDIIAPIGTPVLAPEDMTLLHRYADSCGSMWDLRFMGLESRFIYLFGHIAPDAIFLSGKTGKGLIAIAGNSIGNITAWKSDRFIGEHVPKLLGERGLHHLHLATHVPLSRTSLSHITIEYLQNNLFQTEFDPAEIIRLHFPFIRIPRVPGLQYY